MDSAPPPFFNRGPAPLVRVTFFGLLAVLIMVLDARFGYVEALRQALAVIIYPLQRAALAPFQATDAVVDYFRTQSSLQHENAQLRERALKNAKDLLTLHSLAAENDHLRRLLDARKRSTRSATMAQVLYASRDPFSHKVIVDKGSRAGVRAGEAVIDEIGVVGQVTRVYPLESEVTLVTDKDQAVPVQVVRNGLRAVVFGSGDGQTLELRFMATNADIRNGDMLVTSGLGGTYPEGLPVAKVSRIERDASYMFAKITCTPAAGANRDRQVLLLSLAQNLPARPETNRPAGEPRAKPPRRRARRKA